MSMPTERHRAETTSKVVCHFGAFPVSQAYSHNLCVARALEAAGWKVLSCRLDDDASASDRVRSLRSPIQLVRTVARRVGNWGRLWRRHRKARGYDVLLVGYPAHLEIFLGAALARWRRRPVVMDAFIGLYDTVVRDRRLLSPRHPLARLLWRMEWLALHLADGVMVDTDEHARGFASDFGIPADHVFAVPVGVDERVWRRLPLPPEGDAFRVALWSTFIPLHGMEYVAKAAKIVGGTGLPVRFEVVGDGQTADRFAAALAELAPDNVLWRRGFFEMEEIVALAGRSHCCLGIMGTSEKAARVVPYKVYQALAAGRPVITADTAAVRGVLVDGESALLVSPGDAQGLAKAIVQLAGDRHLCERLAEGARAAYEEHLSERMLARTLDSELTRIVEQWQRRRGGRPE